MVTTPMPVLNGTDMADPLRMIQYTNTIVPEGMFGVLMLILVMGVAIRALDNMPFSSRLLATLAAGFITSIMLVGLGLLGAFWSEALLVLVVIAWFLSSG